MFSGTQIRDAWLRSKTNEKYRLDLESVTVLCQCKVLQKRTEINLTNESKIQSSLWFVDQCLSMSQCFFAGGRNTSYSHIEMWIRSFQEDTRTHVTNKGWPHKLSHSISWQTEGVGAWLFEGTHFSCPKKQGPWQVARTSETNISKEHQVGCGICDFCTYWMVTSFRCHSESFIHNYDKVSEYK